MFYPMGRKNNYQQKYDGERRICIFFKEILFNNNNNIPSFESRIN